MQHFTYACQAKSGESIVLSSDEESPLVRLRCLWHNLLLGIWLIGCSGPSSPDDESLQPTVSRSSPPASEFSTRADAAIPSRTPDSLIGRPAASGDWFEEVTSEMGVDFAYRDGSEAACYQLLESVGGGVAAIDFDNDGFQDLFFTGGGELARTPADDRTLITVSGKPGRLYLSRQGQTFSNVTNEAQVSESSLYTHGSTITDLNADGFQDIVVAGFGGVQVWLNMGDGTFRESSATLGIKSDLWNVTPAAADYDGDGLVDLYLVTYTAWEPDLERKCLNDQQLRDLCAPTMFSGVSDRVFRNTGASFQDVTDTLGLVEGNRGLGIVAADFDHNGGIDFLVVNDVQENQLYWNSNGVLSEDALLAGVAYSNTGEREGSMGIDIADYDGDGFADVWYTNYTSQDNSLLRSANGSGFLHAEGVAGLTGVSRRWVGFGTGFADFDCDGWDDLYVINGHVYYEALDSPYHQPAQLFRNVNGRRFQDVSPQGGPYFSVTRSGRGAVRVDFDNNGTLDLVITHQNDPVSVLRNRHSAPYWIRLDLIGVSGERVAVGAVAELRTEGRTIRRWKYSGGSYLSHHDSRLLYHLETDDPVDIVVTWLGGERETFSGLHPQATHILRQGWGRGVQQ